MVRIKINNVDVEAKVGMTVLEAAKEYGINIPTLCYYPDLKINSDCRICSVEVEGEKNLLTACATIVKEGMQIKTNSTKVHNVRKTITELILANHDTNCTSCPRNLNCELQDLSKNLGIEENRFSDVLEIQAVDDHNPSIYLNPNRCIKCGRCIEVCKEIEGTYILEYLGRSKELRVSPKYGRFLSDEDCTFCGQCASVCPVAAITEKDDTQRVFDAINDPKKHVIVHVGPSIRVSIGEEFGNQSGGEWTGQLISALRLLGFDKVYDTDFTADLTIVEEGHELLERIKNSGDLPMFTSCCPGWVNYAEQEHPDILSHLSTCKSPQQMFGALAKTYYAKKSNIAPENIYVVSVMPCTAKKYESYRKEMMSNENIHDVDAVLTTRELGKMIRNQGIDFNHLKDTKFDKTFGISTGAAAIFGATGGVMEATLRTISEIANNKPLEKINFKSVRGLNGIKEATVYLEDNPVKVAVAHTLKHAETLIQQVKSGESEYTFIEVMACPGGCIGGGGQPYGTTNKNRIDRISSIYRVDESMALRKSHENPSIIKLYEDFLEKPLGEVSHTLLHTQYKARNKI